MTLNAALNVADNGGEEFPVTDDTIPTTPRRKRFQFSLLTLLLVVVMLGAIMGFWFAQRETNRLRAENRQLREELGVLAVGDPAKFYARALVVNDNLKWRWRIYFPNRRSYRINLQTARIDDFGRPSGSGSSTTFLAEKGEYAIELEARKISPGHVELHLLLPSGNMTTSAQTLEPGFDDWADGSSTTSQLNHASTEYDPDKPLELLRLRAMQRTTPNSSTSATTPCPGLLVWIEPDAPPQTVAPAGSVPKPAGK